MRSNATPHVTAVPRREDLPDPIRSGARGSTTPWAFRMSRGLEWAGTRSGCFRPADGKEGRPPAADVPNRTGEVSLLRADGALTALTPGARPIAGAAGAWRSHNERRRGTSNRSILTTLRLCR
ncbi:hypothetical protein NDU88_006787 [Pleurodeles waltl]|uniref:Uncharacterized protein n=1 Tax=Pleurodeles waltl TaxID=8319 RepID=A0AAV7UMH7_PLEWA|nr:hypothetical protein NDU88_006787 [Pleurodeles waltl]